MNFVQYYEPIQLTMAKKKIEFSVFSPDGFGISPDTFKTEKEAMAAFKQWAKRYNAQGYYGSCYGRIALKDLQSKCLLVTIENGKESYKPLS